MSAKKSVPQVEKKSVPQVEKKSVPQVDKKSLPNVDKKSLPKVDKKSLPGNNKNLPEVNKETDENRKSSSTKPSTPFGSSSSEKSNASKERLTDANADAVPAQMPVSGTTSPRSGAGTKNSKPIANILGKKSLITDDRKLKRKSTHSITVAGTNTKKAQNIRVNSANTIPVKSGNKASAPGIQIGADPTVRSQGVQSNVVQPIKDNRTQTDDIGSGHIRSINPAIQNENKDAGTNTISSAHSPTKGENIRSQSPSPPLQKPNAPTVTVPSGTYTLLASDKLENLLTKLQQEQQKQQSQGQGPKFFTLPKNSVKPASDNNSPISPKSIPKRSRKGTDQPKEAKTNRVKGGSVISPQPELPAKENPEKQAKNLPPKSFASKYNRTRQTGITKRISNPVSIKKDKDNIDGDISTISFSESSTSYSTFSTVDDMNMAGEDEADDYMVYTPPKWQFRKRSTNEMDLDTLLEAVIAEKNKLESEEIEGTVFGPDGFHEAPQMKTRKCFNPCCSCKGLISLRTWCIWLGLWHIGSTIFFLGVKILYDIVLSEKFKYHHYDAMDGAMFLLLGLLGICGILLFISALIGISCMLLLHAAFGVVASICSLYVGISIVSCNCTQGMEVFALGICLIVYPFFLIYVIVCSIGLFMELRAGIYFNYFGELYESKVKNAYVHPTDSQTTGVGDSLNYLESHDVI